MSPNFLNVSENFKTENYLIGENFQKWFRTNSSKYFVKYFWNISIKLFTVIFEWTFLVCWKIALKYFCKVIYFFNKMFQKPSCCVTLFQFLLQPKRNYSAFGSLWHDYFLLSTNSLSLIKIINTGYRKIIFTLSNTTHKKESFIWYALVSARSICFDMLTMVSKKIIT